MVKLRIFVLLGVVILGLLGTTAVASAADPFLCPVVSDAVKAVADVNNGDNGVATLFPNADAPPALVTMAPTTPKYGVQAGVMLRTTRTSPS